MIGIYKIENLINGKKYIGQSIDIERRITQHRQRYNNINCEEYNKQLYVDMRLLGIKNFSFTVLEECEVEVLDEKEQFWIQYYNTVEAGYNITFGGKTHYYIPSKIINEELFNNIYHDLLSNELSLLSISKKYDVSYTTIQDINTGSRYYHNDVDYPIRKVNIYEYKELNDLNKKYYCVDCGIRLIKNTKRCPSCAKDFLIKVKDKPSKDQLIIDLQNMSCRKVGAKYNVSDKSIMKWCEAYGLPNTMKEFKKLYAALH